MAGVTKQDYTSQDLTGYEGRALKYVNDYLVPCVAGDAEPMLCEDVLYEYAATNDQQTACVRHAGYGIGYAGAVVAKDAYVVPDANARWVTAGTEEQSCVRTLNAATALGDELELFIDRSVRTNVITGPLSYEGSIAVNTDFPLIAAVSQGDYYQVTASCIDNAGATYTNTGLQVLDGDEIVWNGTTWDLLGGERSRTAVSTTPYTVLDDDDFIDVDTSALAIECDLPTAVGRSGKRYFIKDSTGDAGTRNITIDPNGAETIDGAATYVIATDYGVCELISNGTNWEVVNLSAHAARHLPGGADALTCAAAGAIEPDAAAAEGAAATFARSDHTHSNVCAAAGTIEPDDAAAEGVATSFARSDHQHAIVAAVAGGIAPDDAAAEGVATSFARSDHTHAFPCAAPGTGIGAGNTEGVAVTSSRSDHDHTIRESGGQDLTMGAVAASELVWRTGNTLAGRTEEAATLAGLANSAAAKDMGGGAITNVTTVDGVTVDAHQARHVPGGADAIPCAAAGTIEPDDAAAEGVAVTLARSDHQHAIVGAAPAAGIGAGNTEGVASSFARSDHDHTIAEGGGQDLTMATIAAGEVLQRVGNTIDGTLLDETEVATYTAGAATAFIPICYHFDLIDQTLSTDITVVADMRVIDVWGYKDSAAGGGAATVLVHNLTLASDITDAMVLNINDETRFVSTTIDDAAAHFSAGDTLRITQAQGGGNSACEVNVLCYKRA